MLPRDSVPTLNPLPGLGFGEMFYHGTRKGFTKGGWLFPASFHKGPIRPGGTQDANTWVYFTTDLDLAWDYADDTIGRGKPKVLVVQPYGEILEDASPYDYERNQYKARMAKVIKVIRSENLQ